jgi:hypothetical protein
LRAPGALVTWEREPEMAWHLARALFLLLAGTGKRSRRSILRKNDRTVSDHQRLISIRHFSDLMALSAA